MKYLRKFETEADVNMSVLPNVVLVGDTGKIVYNALNGVFIQHIDGTLYTTDEWTAKGFSNDEANGVAVGNGEVAFVLAKDNISTSINWASDTSTLVEGVLATTDRNASYKDFDGARNTRRILSIDKSQAAYLCANHIFPNGNKGYLPAVGEINMVVRNFHNVNNALQLIGGTALSSVYLWSSTQYNATTAWCGYCAYGMGAVARERAKNTANYVRPFTTL